MRKEVDADAAAIREQGTLAHIASALWTIGAPKRSASTVEVGFLEMDSVDARIEALRTGRWNKAPMGGSAVGWSVGGILLLLALIASPGVQTQGWWAVAFSVAACPAWLLLFWTQLKKRWNG